MEERGWSTEGGESEPVRKLEVCVIINCSRSSEDQGLAGSTVARGSLFPLRDGRGAHTTPTRER